MASVMDANGSEVIAFLEYLHAEIPSCDQGHSSGLR